MQYCKGTGTYRHYKHLYRRRKTDEGHGRTSEQCEDVGGWGKATYHAIPTSHTVFVPETCFMVVENLPESKEINGEKEELKIWEILSTLENLVVRLGYQSGKRRRTNPTYE